MIRKALRYPNPDSYIRRRVARILSEGFGWTVDPADIHPVQGRYRSDGRADIHRWELFGYNDGQLRGSWACWETLTNFAKLATKHGWHASDGYIYIRKEK